MLPRTDSSGQGPTRRALPQDGCRPKKRIEQGGVAKRESRPGLKSPCMRGPRYVPLRKLDVRPIQQIEVIWRKVGIRNEEPLSIVYMTGSVHAILFVKNSLIFAAA
jgi:hypothetical protein